MLLENSLPPSAPPHNFSNGPSLNALDVTKNVTHDETRQKSW